MTEATERGFPSAGAGTLPGAEPDAAVSADRHVREYEERMAALLLLLADFERQQAPGTALAVKPELERLAASLKDARAQLHGQHGRIVFCPGSQ